MKKLLLLAFTLSSLAALGQDQPLYDAAQQSSYDPDVWRLTRNTPGHRLIDLYYTSLAEITDANTTHPNPQLITAEARRAQIRHDSVDYAGGVMLIAAACTDRNTMDGPLTIVVLDDHQHELLRRDLLATEAELSVSSHDFARIYAVPINRPLPFNSSVVVMDNPASQCHEFLIRSTYKPLADK